MSADDHARRMLPDGTVQRRPADPPEDTRPPREFCRVAEHGCLNPPGYSAGNGWANNRDGARIRIRCTYCGEAVCRACRTGKRGTWVCIDHDPEEVAYLLDPQARRLLHPQTHGWAPDPDGLCLLCGWRETDPRHT